MTCCIQGLHYISWLMIIAIIEENDTIIKMHN